MRKMSSKMHTGLWTITNNSVCDWNALNGKITASLIGEQTENSDCLVVVHDGIIISVV